MKRCDEALLLPPIWGTPRLEPIRLVACLVGPFTLAGVLGCQPVVWTPPTELSPPTSHTGATDAGTWAPSPDASQVPEADDTMPLGPPEPPTLVLADHVSVQAVSALQALEVPLLGTATSGERVPLVASKDTAIRVALRTNPGFVPTELTLRVMLAGQAERFESTHHIAGSSLPGAIDNHLMVEIPGRLVQPGLQIAVQVLSRSGTANSPVGHPAAWPTSGFFAMNIEPGIRLNIVLVPVINTNDPEHGAITIDERRLALYRETFVNQLPVDPTRFSLSVHAPHRTQQRINSGGRNGTSYHSRMLDEMDRLHRADGAALTTVYYGLLSYDHERFPCNECPGGIAQYSTAFNPYRLTQYQDGAIIPPCGVGNHFHELSTTEQTIDVLLADGVSEEDAREWIQEDDTLDDPVLKELIVDYGLEQIRDTSPHYIAVHEVLHTLGISHVISDREHERPSMNSRAPTFPYRNGGIGRAAYDSRLDTYFPPDALRDIMTYSYGLTWVSDYHYRLLFEEGHRVGSSRQALARRETTVHHRALARLHSGVIRGATITGQARLAPKQDASTGIVLFPRDAAGRPLEPVLAHYVPHSHPQSAHLYFPAVSDAIVYEIRRWGQTVEIHAMRGPR